MTNKNEPFSEQVDPNPEDANHSEGGTTVDSSLALKWYKRSAKNGNIFSQYNLAGMYYHGTYVQQDYTSALHWYREVAEQGSEKAQFMVGHMYENGQGTPQDNLYAYVWFNLAASQGNETAQDKRERIAERMTPSQLEEAQCISKAYFQRYVRPFT